ncbi:MAG: hypothetical protein H7138_09605 [Myxococcales bacterium]|nr:hypothetical protein [Myxococcales bacterium]
MIADSSCRLALIRFARVSSLREMISGTSDATAGAWITDAQPCTSSSTKYSAIGAPDALMIARPRPIRPVDIAAIVASARRSERSTSVPAGTNSSTTGATWATPTAASASLLPVRT